MHGQEHLSTCNETVDVYKAQKDNRYCRIQYYTLWYDIKEIVIVYGCSSITIVFSLHDASILQTKYNAI